MTVSAPDPTIPELSEDELVARLPRPDSLLRRRISDPRAGAGAAGYALALQVAHPTIAAGVRDHSQFEADPWGRLFRTTDYVFLLGYGDPETVRTLSRNLRQMHRAIRGTDPDGRRYSALEPAAYAWVHATIGIAIIEAHDTMGTRFRAGEREQLWAEWLDLGDVLGVQRAHLPATWGEVDGYVTRMIDDVLEDNDVMQTVKRTARFPVGGSPLRWLPDRVWAVAAAPLGPALHFLGVGMLPPVLRQRLGLRWTRAHQAAFVVYCAASRATTPVLPRRVKQSGPFLLRLRRKETGPFGAPNGDARWTRRRAR